MCAGGSGRVVSPRPSSSFHPREAASLRKSPLPPLVLQAAHVGEVLPLVVAEARRAEPPPLLYAALRGWCAPSLASSSLRPTSRSDRPTSTAAPSRTNPATTGTEMAAPASRETRPKPPPATSSAFMGASVHCLGARATYHEGQSPGPESRRPPRQTLR